MSDVVISGLFTLAGVLLGSVSSFLLTRDVQRQKRLEEYVVRLARQVGSYWELEGIYSKELAEAKGRSERTILLETRDKVEQLGRERPELTSKDADSIRRKFE